MPISGSEAFKWGWQIACLCLLCVFLPALVTSLGYSLTDALGPGPGFFPFWLSLTGAVLSAVMLAQVTIAKADEGIDLSLAADRRVALQAYEQLVALPQADVSDFDALARLLRDDQPLEAARINELAWHNLFIRTLLVRPEAGELPGFVPEFTIIDLPSFRASASCVYALLWAS